VSRRRDGDDRPDETGDAIDELGHIQGLESALGMADQSHFLARTGRAPRDLLNQGPDLGGGVRDGDKAADFGEVFIGTVGQRKGAEALSLQPALQFVEVFVVRSAEAMEEDDGVAATGTLGGLAGEVVARVRDGEGHG